MQGGEGLQDPPEDGVVELEAGRAAAVGQVPRPLRVDVGAGEPGPLAGVALAEPGLAPHRADAQPLGDEGRGGRGPLQIAGHHGVDRPDRVGGRDGLLHAEW